MLYGSALLILTRYFSVSSLELNFEKPHPKSQLQLAVFRLFHGNRFMLKDHFIFYKTTLLIYLICIITKYKKTGTLCKIESEF